MDQQLKYNTCSFRKGNEGGESGSGVIVKVEGLDELLKENSCLSVKIGRESNLQTPCYALITAHSIIYAPDVPDEHIPDEQVADRVKQQQLKIIFGKSAIEIPLEDCIQCRAVSCCGRDSILRLTEDLLRFTLMPHKHTHECHIDLDFVILFLNKEFANKLPKTHQPPSLDIMQCWGFPDIFQKSANSHYFMYWRCEGGKVEKATVENVKIPHKFEDERGQLRDEIKTFTAHQVLQYDRADTQSHIGAPVVLQTANGKGYVVGINTGAGISTFYGITKLLKGGVVPFLSVMQHSNVRLLKPSRYEPYIVPHIESLHVADMGRYLVDLLHYLAVKDSEGVAILKLDVPYKPAHTVAAFNILTAIFMKFKEIDGHAPAFKHHDGRSCECFIELCSIIRNNLEHFKADRTNVHLTEKVEAMFCCLEAMLNYEDMAREFLNGSDSVDSLIELAKSELYVSNTTIQRCVLNIVQQERHYQKEVKQTYEDSKQVCEELQKKNEELQKKHARLEQTHEELQKELEQTQKELEQTQKELEQTQKELEQTQKDHEILQQEHGFLEREKENMQKRSMTLDRDYTELQERHRQCGTRPLNFNDPMSLSSGNSEMSSLFPTAMPESNS